MNALRFGGSQTFAASLAGRLARRGFEIVFVAKPGEHSRDFDRRWSVHHVFWAEGVGTARGPKQGVARFAGYCSLAMLGHKLRDNPPIAWIASQPWPIHYAAVSRGRLWPSAVRIGLVHGTTAVEIPPPGGLRELAAMDRLYTSTLEGAAALTECYGLEATSIGNLFDADDFWRCERSAPDDQVKSSSQVLFLGTLTPNKVPPLRALLELARGDESLRLRVVGEGSERADLEAVSLEQGGGERVFFRGGLLDPRAEIERADVVVGAGRAAIEAASRPRRVVVADGNGILGALTPDCIPLCEHYNFTGRAPASGRCTAAEMARAIRDARKLSKENLAANARVLSEVGDLAPLLDFLAARSPPPDPVDD